jgi:NitT/TauT family transport system substrate-binding protein
MRITNMSAATGLWLLATLTTGCSEAKPRTLRLGLNPWPGYELLYVAAEEGLFQSAGLDVKIVEFESLTDTRHAYEVGQIDALASTLVEVHAAMRNSERRLKVVLATDYSNGADEILADESVATPADLRGKAIGYERDSLGHYMLVRALGAHGMTLADVKPVHTDQTQVLTLLGSGAVAAVVTYPPHSIAAAKLPGMHRIFSSTEIPGEILDVVSVDEEWLEQIPDLALRFQEVWSKALGLLANDNSKTLSRMAKRLRLTNPELEATLQGLKMVGISEQATLLSRSGTVQRALTGLATILSTKPPHRDDTRPTPPGK